MTTELKLGACEGGLAGTEMWGAISAIACKFLAVGIKAIESACNSERERRLDEWRGMPGASFMIAYGLGSVTYAQGITEADPPFALFEPVSITVNVWASRKSVGNQGLAAMGLQRLDDAGTLIELHVYLQSFEKTDQGYIWKGYNMSLEDVMLHELLHACGDVPCRGRRDGIVRQNIIGGTAVRALLRQQGP